MAMDDILPNLSLKSAKCHGLMNENFANKFLCIFQGGRFYFLEHVAG